MTDRDVSEISLSFVFLSLDVNNVLTRAPVRVHSIRVSGSNGNRRSECSRLDQFGDLS